MCSAARSSDISIHDPRVALQLCEGLSSAFHSSPRACDNLIAITCDTELLLVKLLCSGSSVLSSHCVRRIQGCSPGYSPQIIADQKGDAVLFLRPDGLCRVRDAGEWAGETEAAGPMGSFSATRDGRYVAVKRAGHGVSAQLAGSARRAWQLCIILCVGMSWFTRACRL
jgi:hypothetical protein